MEEPTKSRPWWQWVVAGVMVVTVVALAVFLGYVRPAKAASAAYQSRLNSSSLAFTGDLEFYGKDFLSALDSKMSFMGDYQKQPFVGSAGFNGTWAQKPYVGGGVIKDGRLFFRLSGPQLPVIRYKQSTFLLPLKPEWYSAKADDSLFDNICQNTTPANPANSLELYRRIKELKLRPSWWVDFFDRQGTHFKGQLDSKQLPALAEAFQNALPAGCGLNTIGITAGDTSSMKVDWDLWTNPKSDHLQLTVEDKTLGSRLLFNLQTSGYGLPVNVQPPSQAIDLSQIYANVKPQYQY